MGYGEDVVIDLMRQRCQDCGTSFSPADFLSHVCGNLPVNSSEAVGILDPVSCQICHRTFKNKNSLKVHKSNYHRTERINHVPRVSSGLRLSHATVAEMLNRSYPVKSEGPQVPQLQDSRQRTEPSDAAYRQQYLPQNASYPYLLQPDPANADPRVPSFHQRLTIPELSPLLPLHATGNQENTSLDHIPCPCPDSSTSPGKNQHGADPPIPESRKDNLEI